MSEELLRAIIQLFAIVAKERITEDERQKIKEFLSLHLNQEAIRYYLGLFDDFCKENKRLASNDLANVIASPCVRSAISFNPLGP